MDLVSHAVVGLTLYQTRRKNTFANSRPVFWATLIGSELPDIDILYKLEGDLSYLLHHRGFTHSVPGLFLLATVTALFLKQFYPRADGRKIFLWTLLAGASHVILDIFNTWGTMGLYPLSQRWLALDCLPFIDPILLSIMAVGLYAVWRRPRHRRKFAHCALALVMAYVTARGLIHHQLVRSIAAQFPAVPITKISVLPTVSLTRWDTVLETPRWVLTGEISLFHPHRIRRRVVHNIVEDPALDPVRYDRRTASVLAFFRYPVLSLRNEGGQQLLVIEDLYYGRKAFRRAVLTRSPDGSFIPYGERKLQDRLGAIPVFLNRMGIVRR